MNKNMRKLSKVYQKFLEKRNKEIIKLRKQGKQLKYLANKFKLSIRQINRIIKNMSKNV
jgi:Mor family transcriptional regulator